MAERTAEQRRAAFRRFVEQRYDGVMDMCRKVWGPKRAKSKANAIYNFLNGPARSLSHETASPIAQHAKVAMEDLFGDSFGSVNSPIERGWLVGSVRAGAWQEAVEWPRNEWDAVDLPPSSRARGKPRFFLVVQGTSMDEVYPEGTLLECVKLTEYGGELHTGKRVILHRQNELGLIEATCKELEIKADGTAWLWPRSTDPRWQQPLPMPADIATTGKPHKHDGESMYVHAVVTRAVIEQP